MATYRRDPAGSWIAGLGAVVTTNDWSPEMGDVVESARRYGVPAIGRMVGVHDIDDLRTGRDRSAFRSVDLVLCQGAADAAAVTAFGGTPVVVGNARLETLWRRPAASADKPMVVIHSNFAAGQVDDERLFLKTALAACASVDVPAVVTGAVNSDGVEVDARPLDAVLGTASLLVARFGGAPFDAMARGVPFIYHDPHGEKMPLFATANGAFDTTTSSDELGEAIAHAMGSRAQARDRSEAFFRHHVDMTEVPATVRMADAIAAAIAERR